MHPFQDEAAPAVAPDGNDAVCGGIDQGVEKDRRPENIVFCQRPEDIGKKKNQVQDEHNPQDADFFPRMAVAQEAEQKYGGDNHEEYFRRDIREVVGIHEPSDDYGSLFLFCPGGCPFDNGAAEQNVVFPAGKMFPVDHIHDQVAGTIADFVKGDCHGGQGRIGDCGNVTVIEAHDGNFFSDVHACLGTGVDGADRHQVVQTENRVGFFGNQFFGQAIAGVAFPVADPEEGRIIRNALLIEGFLKTGQAVDGMDAAQRTGDDADFFMPAVQQVEAGFLAGFFIVIHNGRD